MSDVHKACGTSHPQTPLCPDTKTRRRYDQLHPGMSDGKTANPQLVVEIRGGNLERVFRWYPPYRDLPGVDKDIDYELIDWDNIEAGDEAPEVAKLLYPDDVKEASDAA